MSWASGFKLPTALPSLEQLKKSVDSSVKAVNANLQDAAKNFDSGVRVLNESVREAASSVKDAAGQVHAPTSKELLSTVRGVFDLDALSEAQGDGKGAKKRPGSHFPGPDVTYVTQRVAVMGFPDAPRQGRTAAKVGAFLNERHGDDYMVWNLSERQYDYQQFRGQVMDFKFPGYPAPPLGTLFQLCMAIESWLNSDARNVAIVHCMTGRGRSLTVVACLLEWIGKAASSQDALAYACRKRRAHIDQALVPTQLRYADMFHRVLQGERPRYAPVRIKTLVLHGIPNMLSAEDMTRPEMPPAGGCRPYLQIYKDGVCLFTTTEADAKNEGGTAIVKSGPSESCSMPVDCVVEGDLLLRLRHVDTSTGKGVPMFRYGFHTGYVAEGVLRLRRADLDSASVDERFAEDLAVEIEFELASAKTSEEGSGTQGIEVDDVADNIFGPEAPSAAAAEAFWNEVERKKALASKRTSADERKIIGPHSSAGPARGLPPGQPGEAAHEFSILDEEDEDHGPGPKVAESFLDADGNRVSARGGPSLSNDDLRDELNALTMDDGAAGGVDLGGPGVGEALQSDPPLAVESPERSVVSPTDHVQGPPASSEDMLGPAVQQLIESSSDAAESAGLEQGTGSGSIGATLAPESDADAGAVAETVPPGLDDLDELERDLDLDLDLGLASGSASLDGQAEEKGTSMKKEPGSLAGASPSLGGSGDDPDLAELEEYLAGL